MAKNVGSFLFLLSLGFLCTARCHIIDFCDNCTEPVEVIPVPEPKPQPPPKPTCRRAAYMALLGYGYNVAQTDYPGKAGTIISDQYIITDAYLASNVWRVALGVNNPKEPRNNWQIYEVRVITHPNHRHPENSIALLHTTNRIQFNPNVQPAKLPTYDIISSVYLLPTWRNYQDTDNGPIRHVSVERYAPSECRAKYNVFQTALQDCYGHRANQQESCSVYCGEPAIIEHDSCDATITGIVWWGTYCAGPLYFTKVSYYLSWIQSVMAQ